MIALGGVLALLLFDRLERLARRRRWRRVSHLTIAALCAHLSDVVSDFATMLPLRGMRYAPLGLGREKPDHDAATAFDRFARYAIERDAWRTTEEGTHGLYDEVRWDLDRVIDNLLPRVADLADDPILVERLVALEHARHGWMNSLIVDRRARDTSGTIVGAVGLLPAVVGAYQHLVDAYGDLMAEASTT